MKNIPIPPKNSYLKCLIGKVESVIKRMRWKAHFYGKNSDERNLPTSEIDTDADGKYGFKSRKCPPQHEDLDRFEADLMDMVNNIQVRKRQNKFQTQLNNDIKNKKLYESLYPHWQNK